ncbi:tyrosine-type recombinase/integrase [Geodermatophilus ruber]|uniref:Site-specific recombinase XerD n=1 Tax=Geodermatophilus ruber TaxID=504800 RepID=A0A1I4CYX4_9ACTN|nr:tyrosine-type recombinase/integrase [Geodermatophilus ruber]SFK85840.1 Site-specific recombinase XerD [Geodermatophilus ruber]
MTRSLKQSMRPEPQRRKGTGSVAQLPSGKWRPRLTVRGQQVVFQPTLYESREDALAALDRYLEETDATRDKRAQGERLLGAEVARYIDERVLYDDLSESSESDLRDLARNVIGAPEFGIGHLRLVDLAQNRTLARTWMSKLKEVPERVARGREGKPRQGASRRIKALRLARAAIKEAIDENWIDRDPFKDVRAVKKGKTASSVRKAKFFFTPAEIVELCVSAPAEKDRLMLEVALWAGLRPGEVRAMDGITVLPAEPKLNVEYSLNEKCVGGAKRGPVKNRKSRLVTIPKPLWQRLLAWSEAQGRRPGQPLFPSATGGWWLYGVWSRYSWQPTLATAAKALPTLNGDPTTHVKGRRLAPTPYAMRATYISMLQAAGVSQRRVQAQVGHEGGSMVTDIYSMSEEDGVVEWREARKVRAKGWGLQKTLTAMYNAIWAAYGPDGGRDSLASDVVPANASYQFARGEAAEEQAA